MQRVLTLPVTGAFGPDENARVLGFQLARGLPRTGLVDERTAEAIGEAATFGLVPSWYPDLDVAVEILGCELTDTADAIRRFQSANHLPVTGELDEATATLMGEPLPA